VAETLALREGACRGCAECCDLLFRCPYLGADRRCGIYERRFKPCSAFPVDQWDLKNIACGFSYPGGPGSAKIPLLPLSPFGRPELPLVAIAAIVGVCSSLAIAWLDGLPAAGYASAAAFMALLTFTLFFFRDPARVAPPDDGGLLAPADGRVTDVTEVEEPEFLGGKAVRVGIFMSLFDVHVNRSPCSGMLRFRRHREGGFGHAMKPESWTDNENLLLGLESPGGKVAVRLVSGAVARRISCPAVAGVRLCRGERIGMVKFGSRAELMVQAGGAWEASVSAGDRVTAGVTTLFARTGATTPGGA
jgi:phosphatidylserine decarboxylase